MSRFNSDALRLLYTSPGSAALTSLADGWKTASALTGYVPISLGPPSRAGLRKSFLFYPILDVDNGTAVFEVYSLRYGSAGNGDGFTQLLASWAVTAGTSTGASGSLVTTAELFCDAIAAPTKAAIQTAFETSMVRPAALNSPGSNGPGTIFVPDLVGAHAVIIVGKTFAASATKFNALYSTLDT